jgi:hypothetical protein
VPPAWLHPAALLTAAGVLYPQLPLKYVAIFVVSMMFPALDSITKEKVRSLWELFCVQLQPCNTCSWRLVPWRRWLHVVVVQPLAPWPQLQRDLHMHLSSLAQARCVSGSDQLFVSAQRVAHPMLLVPRRCSRSPRSGWAARTWTSSWSTGVASLRIQRTSVDAACSCSPVRLLRFPRLDHTCHWATSLRTQLTGSRAGSSVR